MIQFFTGIVAGIWLGTTYNFKPQIAKINSIIKENFPEKGK